MVEDKKLAVALQRHLQDEALTGHNLLAAQTVHLQPLSSVADFVNNHLLCVICIMLS